MPPFTAARGLTTWVVDWPVVYVLAAVAAAYVVLLLLAHHHGERFPAWRVAAFLVLGMGSIVVCTMSSLAAYNHTVFWPFAVQVTLLISIVPVCIALGDPIGLARLALPTGRRGWYDAMLNSLPVRAVTFPLVTPILATVVQLVVFLSPLLAHALASDTVLNLVYLLVLGTGCLVSLPMLGVDLLPAWCTEPFRVLVAAVDGLLDAVPAIVVLTSTILLAQGYYLRHRPPWLSTTVMFDQQVGGGLMLVLAEVVAVPMLGILFFQWVRADLADVPPDALRAPLPAPAGAHDPAEPLGDRPGAKAPAEPALERPWWETDPRFDRTRGVGE